MQTTGGDAMTVPTPDFLIAMNQASGATVTDYGTVGSVSPYIIDTAGATEGVDWIWRPSSGPWIGRYEGVTDGGANMPWWDKATITPTPGITAPETVNVMIGFYIRTLQGSNGTTLMSGGADSAIDIGLLPPTAGGDFKMRVICHDGGTGATSLDHHNMSFNTYYMVCVTLDASVSPAVISTRIDQATPTTFTHDFSGQNMSDKWPYILRDAGFTIYFGLDGYLTAYAYQRGGTMWSTSDTSSINADPAFIVGWPSSFPVVDLMGQIQV
jgi:hypothetical protein